MEENILFPAAKAIDTKQDERECYLNLELEHGAMTALMVPTYSYRQSYKTYSRKA